ncbi:MAG: DNA/RNA nuclease SfsA [Clostridiales bacterium]|nr:DNA/RNA nuclease SfsA [Clostridiales bacterium]
MTYQDIHPARFIARPNRFIARVELDGREETVHVKNTGRCKELLLPGCTVYLEGSANPQRKTKFDLVAVEKLRPDGPPLLINMDAQAPNRVFGEWMAAGLGAELGLPKPSLLRPETTWGNSRFDFYWEFSPELPENKTYVSRETPAPRRGFIEVKGCTLEEDGLALFPDAPTERGVKHLRELIACHKAGYEAAVCVVIQMEGMTAFSPNDRTHPEFGAALREAAQAGVKVLAVECAVTPDSLTMTRPVPVRL